MSLNYLGSRSAPSVAILILYFILKANQRKMTDCSCQFDGSRPQTAQHASRTRLLGVAAALSSQASKTWSRLASVASVASVAWGSDDLLLLR